MYLGATPAELGGTANKAIGMATDACAAIPDVFRSHIAQLLRHMFIYKGTVRRKKLVPRAGRINAPDLQEDLPKAIMGIDGFKMRQRGIPTRGERRGTDSAAQTRSAQLL